MIYETPLAASGAPAGLDIESKIDTGPSKETLQEIYGALRELGNEELTKLVEQTVRLVQNGARTGMDPVVCGVDCLNNTFAVSL